MKKLLTVLLHFAVGFLIQLFALIAYIFGAKMDAGQLIGLLLLGISLVCVDYLSCRALDKGELAWKTPRLAHCADLPLMLAPIGLMLYMFAVKLGDDGSAYLKSMLLSGDLVIVGILLVELFLITERILLTRASLSNRESQA